MRALTLDTEKKYRCPWWAYHIVVVVDSGVKIGNTWALSKYLGMYHLNCGMEGNVRFPSVIPRSKDNPAFPTETTVPCIAPNKNVCKTLDNMHTKVEKTWW